MAVAKNVIGAASSTNIMPGGTPNLKTRRNQTQFFFLIMIQKADIGLTSPTTFVRIV